MVVIPLRIAPRRLNSSSGRSAEPQLARVNGHADGGVNPYFAEGFDFTHRRDAAGGGDGEAGDLPQTAEPAQVRPLHHALFVHVGAEEAGAIRFEFRDHVFGAQAGAGTPAFYYDSASVTVERHHQELFPPRSSSRRQKFFVDAAFLER